MSMIPTPIASATFVGTPEQVRMHLDSTPATKQILVVTLGAEGSEQAVRFSNAATRILMLVDDALLDHNDEALELFVQAVLPKTPASPANALQAKMKAASRKAVLDSGDLLTAIQIAEFGRLSASNPSTRPNKWKRARKIFAINHQGVDYFPAYGLDPENDYRPVKAMAEVLEVFGETKGSWGLAYWFTSVNSFLGGKRPQDVLPIDPKRVIEAAKDEVQGALHG